MWLPAAAGFGCFMIKTKEKLVEEGQNRKSKKSDMPLVNWREFHISGEGKVLNLVLWIKVVVKQKRL